MTEPTDRSIPAVMMTRHSPNALMAIQENALSTLKMLVAVRNVLVVTLRKTTIANKMSAMPISCP